MGSRFASRWILLVTAGEALGFTVAIGAALASIALGWDDARMLMAATIAVLTMPLARSLFAHDG